MSTTRKFNTYQDRVEIIKKDPDFAQFIADSQAKGYSKIEATGDVAADKDVVLNPRVTCTPTFFGRWFNNRPNAAMKLHKDQTGSTEMSMKQVTTEGNISNGQIKTTQYLKGPKEGKITRHFESFNGLSYESNKITIQEAYVTPTKKPGM